MAFFSEDYNIFTHISIEVSGNKIQQVRSWEVSSRYVKSAKVYYSDAAYDEDPIYRIKWDLHYHAPISGSKLFIAPKCKIARDIYRNSGYQIVRDADKADYVILPDPPSNCWTYPYDMLLKKDDNIFIVEASTRSPIETGVLTDEEKDTVRQYFISNGYSILMDFDTGVRHVSLLPKNGDWDMYLVSHKYRSSKYCLENEVPFTTTNTISVENLDIWKNMSNDILQKTICQSDWKDYPATIYYFLGHCDNFKDYGLSTNMKYVLSQIGYGSYFNFIRDYQDKLIEPKDWNMLQDWIVHHHFSDYRKDDMIVEKPNDYIDKPFSLVRYRYCVAPLHIDRPMKLSVLMQLLK